MTLKPGDLVIMNKKGFAFHGNPNIMFDAYNVGGAINSRHFENVFCEIMSIQGVGEVVHINDFDLENIAVEVRFKNRVKGLFYFNTMFYDAADLSKLTFFQKLKFKLLGRV